MNTSDIAALGTLAERLLHPRSMADVANRAYRKCLVAAYGQIRRGWIRKHSEPGTSRPHQSSAAAAGVLSVNPLIRMVTEAQRGWRPSAPNSSGSRRAGVPAVPIPGLYRPRQPIGDIGPSFAERAFDRTGLTRLSKLAPPLLAPATPRDVTGKGISRRSDRTREQPRMPPARTILTRAGRKGDVSNLQTRLPLVPIRATSLAQRALLDHQAEDTSPPHEGAFVETEPPATAGVYRNGKSLLSPGNFGTPDLGSWMIDYLERQMLRPRRGMTGVDPRVTPLQ